MKKLTFGALALVGVTSLHIQAQETGVADKVPATEAPASATMEEIKAAVTAYDKAFGEHMQKVRAEKDRKKKMELYHSRPQPTEAVEMIVKTAAANPKIEGIEQALVWGLRTTDVGQRTAIGELLLTHFKDSESIEMLARSWRFDEAKLRDIIKRAGNEKVRQAVTYHLASNMLRSDAKKDEGVTLLKQLQEWPEIATKNPDLLKQVKAELFSLENLAVGSTAPDIVGTDHAGVEFKLSDYRGQVVLLDFWGHW